MKKLFLALFVLSFFSLNAYAIVADVAAPEKTKVRCSEMDDRIDRASIKSTESTQPSAPSVIIEKGSVKTI